MNEGESEVDRRVPVGTPLRAWEWIVPPFLLVASAALEAVLATTAGSRVQGVLLSFGRFALELPLLLVAGHVLANRRYRPVRLLRSVMSIRRWRRVAIFAAIAGVVCLLLEPLAFDLALTPVIVLVMVGRILAPVVFGLALGFRRGAAGLF